MSPTLEEGLKILRIILRHEGKSKAIKSEEIEQLTDVDGRTVREVVHMAVSFGVRLASCSDGYYRPNVTEMNEYLEREKGRLISLAQKISQAKKHTNNELTLWG